MKTGSTKKNSKKKKPIKVSGLVKPEVVPVAGEPALEKKETAPVAAEPKIIETIPKKDKQAPLKHGKDKSAVVPVSPKKHNWKSSLVLGLLIIPLGLYLHFGMLHLGQFETADEYRWIYPDSRIPRYWSAMERKDWKDTMINDKPGIATAIVSGWAMKRMGFDELQTRFIEQNRYSYVFDPAASEIINFTVRLPLLVFNGLLAVLWYFILRRLFENNWAALIAVSLVILSPILIGMSQIVNPDALLWSTAFTAIIAFLAFLKDRKWYDALISGIFLGFALLSKYTAVIIIPYEFALIIAYLVFSYNKFVEEKSFRKRVIQYSIFFPLSVAIGILVYALLMPAVFQMSLKAILKSNDAFGKIYPYFRYIEIALAAMFVDAVILKSWLLKKILFPFKYLWESGSRIFFGGALIIFSAVVWNWNRGNFWGIADIAYDAGNDKTFNKFELIHQIFLEMRPFVFSLAIIVLVLVLLTWLVHIFKRRTPNAFAVFALTLFLPFFYFAVIKANYLTTVRYSIMLYPLVATLAAIGIVELISTNRFRPWLNLAAFSCIIWGSVLILVPSHPFYFSYTNDLLSRSNVISSTWGYGGYEAAQYVNKQAENPKELVAWTDYGGFCQFFAGLCIMDSDIKWVGYKTTNKINYYISTKRGAEQLKSTWAKLFPNTSGEPVWELKIGGRPDNYIRVYEVEKSEFTSDNWWRKKKAENDEDET